MNNMTMSSVKTYPSNDAIIDSILEGFSSPAFMTLIVTVLKGGELVRRKDFD